MEPGARRIRHHHVGAHAPASRSGSTWRTSPGKNVQFVIPFSRAFRAASSIAAGTSSMP